MNDLCKHISNHINRDSETLWSHGGLTRHNLELIQSILQDPTRDYNPIENNAPPYNFKKQASETSMSEKPLVPPRNPSLAEQPKPITQGHDSPPPFHKQPVKPARPPPPASKPVANDKLSGLYKSEKQATGAGSGSGSENRGGQFKDRIADSAASGLGWGVGMGVARRLI